jgi:CRP-like cAMP-binding protein
VGSFSPESAETLVGALRRWPGWQLVPGKVLRDLEEHAGPARLVIRHTSIYKPYEFAEGLYVVKSGMVKVAAVGRDWREEILYFAAPGGVIIEAFLPGNVPTATQAMACRRSEVWRVDTDKLVAVAQRSQELGLALLRTSMYRHNRLHQRVMNVSCRRIHARLAEFLWERVRSILGNSDAIAPDELELPKEPLVIARTISMADLGKRIGSTREEAQRALKRLEVQGICRLEPKILTIFDIDALYNATHG